MTALTSKKKSGLSPVQADLPPPSAEQKLISLFGEQRYAEIENNILGLIQHYPRWLTGWQLLSDTYLIQGKDASQSAKRALELNSNDANEHCYYGLVLKKQGDLKGAASAFEQATRLKPNYAAAYNNLGIVKKDSGDIEAGIRNYRRALELNPNYADCYSNLLFCLSHSEKITTQALFNEHRQFGERYEQSLRASWPKHANQRDPERQLKVGFVSAAFRKHSLSNFVEPVLKYLSRSTGLCLHAYSTSPIEDDVTQRLREKFSHWIKADALAPDGLAQKIRDDGIDILVDLDGHTAGNCLLTFAMKPAPVQASWLGYLATTGLSAMDYYLADHYLLPPGLLDEQFTEKLVQLPANAPFMPSDLAPSVNVLPAISNGYITFASFNRPDKITPSAIVLWSKLLRSLPTSRMLLGAMPQEGSYDALIEWFNREGIPLDRLIFYPRSSIENYLKRHHEADICLDTFPSSGVTTTCHALWMGVPTLCQEGASMTSRGAMAVMSHVGLNGFVAKDQDDFVAKGIHWANNLETLANIRQTLRERFNESNLGQPALIADSLESAFRTMWQNWCKNLPAESFKVGALSGQKLQRTALT